MTITFTMEIGKDYFDGARDFAGLEAGAYRIGLSVGQEVLRWALEGADRIQHDERDKSRYRDKGLRKTSVKTMVGDVDYRRHVYEDRAAVEQPRSVYLLDQTLGINKIGLMSANVCQMAAQAVCEGSYRNAALMLSTAMGEHISHQGVWNIIQRLGEGQQEVTERHTVLAEQHQGLGELETKLLYEENDGVWLALQGKSRKEHGPKKEMKVGIAYDGVRWERTVSGKRRILDEKVAYASFEPAADFRRHKEGMVASRYRVDEVQLKIINGDGAGWVQGKNSDTSIYVLDEFHRNKKLTECVKDKDFAALLRDLLFKNDISTLLSCLEAQINSVQDEPEREKLSELYRYYSENRDSLLSCYDRGQEIPETRQPGVIHHAQLGSMESNVFTLIGNRMKGRRACWSIQGANHLALLLCRKHTIGFEGLFAPLPALPKPSKPEEWETAPILSASKVPERIGHGYEFQTTLTSQNAPRWLGQFVRRLNAF